MDFVENWIKNEKEISSETPKYVLAPFRDVAFQTPPPFHIPQYGNFSGCILWAITFKSSNLYGIANENLSYPLMFSIYSVT